MLGTVLGTKNLAKPTKAFSATSLRCFPTLHPLDVSLSNTGHESYFCNVFSPAERYCPAGDR